MLEPAIGDKKLNGALPKSKKSYMAGIKVQYINLVTKGVDLRATGLPLG